MKDINMYRLMIVDDEPSAREYLREIIEKRCSVYKVIAEAENGRDALKQIKQCVPDLILTDIKMPVMGGLELIEEIQNSYPEIKCILITGFQEFEYAQKAIRMGVCEYVLKPVNPNDLKRLMERMEGQLEQKYYEERISLIKDLSNPLVEPDNKRIEHFFEEGTYYAMLIRQKGAPRRYHVQNGIAICSLPSEKIFVYGRDEQETLYLVAEKYVIHCDFRQYVEEIYEKFRKKEGYTTCVLYQRGFSIQEFSSIIRMLYKKLDRSIVIGKDQIIELSMLDVIQENTKKDADSDENNCMERIRYYIKYGREKKLSAEIGQLFEVWKQEEQSQFNVENQIYYLYQTLNYEYKRLKEFPELLYALDEAFAEVMNLNELKEFVLQTIEQYFITEKYEEDREDEKDRLLDKILIYLNTHIQESISLGDICRQFGVSQTSLYRLFRQKVQKTFSGYLTDLRIKKAKEIMRECPDLYIKDIAERVGYEDQFYFSRIFHSIEGISPSEYMERNSN